MAVIFIFVDGIGLGEPSEHNPFSMHFYPSFEKLTGSRFADSSALSIQQKDHIFKPVDARLGVEGLPQSGTGQTALFTGINAAKHIGKHFGPYPHSGIKPYLQSESLFHKTLKMGLRPAFLNAYPPVFFERSRKINRWSCSTLMVKSAGLELKSTRDVWNGTAVTAEFFGDYWKKNLGIDLPERDGNSVADIILGMSDEHDLILMEYYLTDKAGHNQQVHFAQDVLNRLDQVLNPLIEKNLAHTIVLCSDHGNLEDLSIKTHTLNPVPLVALGPLAYHFEHAKSIMDVSNGILNALK